MKKKLGASFFLQFISFIPLLLTVLIISIIPNLITEWWQYTMVVIALLLFGYNFIDRLLHAKSVSIDDNYLYISNIFREIKTPITNIENVHLTKIGDAFSTENQGIGGLRWPNLAYITIRLKKKTALGKKIMFSTDYPGEAVYSHLKKHENPGATGNPGG